MSPIDPARAEGAFLAGIRHIIIRDGLLAPENATGVVSVVGELAIVVKELTVSAADVDQLMLHRLAAATLNMIEDAFNHRDDAHRTVKTWLTARSELLRNRLRAEQQTT